MPKLKADGESGYVGQWISLRALSSWTPTINVLSRQSYDQAMIILPDALSVRSELQSMTGRALELRYIEEAIQNGMAYKATIEKLEAMCWRAIGQDGRGKKTEEDEQKLTKIFKFPFNGRTANGHVRKAMIELATAQRALHVALFEEFRPGRKRSTRSPAWRILSDVVGELGPQNASIKRVVARLIELAASPTKPGGWRIVCVDRRPQNELFKFGASDKVQNRRAIEDMLVNLRKAPAPENISSEFR